ncbi:MAG: hypothetical protein ACE361_17740 [Aureliella sp.]
MLYIAKRGRTGLISLAMMVLLVSASYVLTEGRRNSAVASTASEVEGKSMVTVPVDAGMEAVVTLDHKTGELTGYVLNRFTGQFFVQYRYNIASDFPTFKGNYLMCSGIADFTGFNGNERLANGVIYIADERTGQVAAYAIPWNSQFRNNTTAPQRRSFVPLDKARTRFM